MKKFNTILIPLFLLLCLENTIQTSTNVVLHNNSANSINNILLQGATNYNSGTINAWNNYSVTVSENYTPICTGISNLTGNLTYNQNFNGNLFTGGAIFNKSGNQITLTISGNSTQDSTWTIPASTNSYVPIVYGATSVTINGTTTNINLDSNDDHHDDLAFSYIIDSNNNVNAYFPFIANNNFIPNNDNTANIASNLKYYTQDPTNNYELVYLTSGGSVGYPGTIIIPATAAIVTCQTPLGSDGNTITISIPVNPIVQGSNKLFDQLNGFNSASTLTNQTCQPILVNFYGTLNTTSNTLLNSVPIYIASYSYIPIISGATSVTIYNSDNTQIYSQSITPTTVFTYSFVPVNNSSYDLIPNGGYLFNNSNSKINSVGLTNSAGKTVVETTNGINGWSYWQWNWDPADANIVSIIYNTLQGQSGTGPFTYYIKNNQIPSNIFYQAAWISNHSGKTGSGYYLNSSNGTNQQTIPSSISNGIYSLFNNTSDQYYIGHLWPVPYGVNTLSKYWNDNNTNDVFLLTNGNLSVENQSWFINNNGNDVQNHTFQDIVYVVNNYSIPAYNFQFYNQNPNINLNQNFITGYPTTGSNSPGGNYLQMPNYTGFVTCDIQLSNYPAQTTITNNIIIPIATNVSYAQEVNYMFIYKSNSPTLSTITNGSSQPIGIQLFGTINRSNNNYPLNSSDNLIYIASGTSFPIINGSTQISVFDENGNQVISNSNISPSSNSYTVTNDGSWKINGGTISSVSITNNSSSNIYDIYFSQAGFNTSFLQANTSTDIPTGCTYATIIQTNGGNSFNIPLSTTSNTNIYNSYNITNTNNTDVYLTFTGTINGTSQALNSSTILLAGGDSFNIPTGTTSVTAYSDQGGSTQIATSSISDSNNYYINYTTQWSITSTPISALLTNNYNATTNTINFYTTGNPTPLTGGSSGVSPWNICGIPTNTNYLVIENSVGAPVNHLYGNSYIYFSGAPTDINLYTDYVLTNITNNPITGTLSNSTGTNPVTFSIPAGQSMQILTGTTNITINNHSPTSFSVQSYTYNGDIFAPYVPSAVNNYTQTITNVNFYSSDPYSTNPIGHFNSINYSFLYGMRAYTSYATFDVTCNDISYTNNKVPLALGQNGFVTQSRFFYGSNDSNTYIITNSSDKTVQVQYIGTLNGVPNQILNGNDDNGNNYFTLNPNQNIPILNGTTNINIFINNGTTQVIQNYSLPLTSDVLTTNLFINNSSNNWEINTTTPISDYYFTNNSNNTCSNLIFYTQSGQEIQYNTASFNTNKTIAIPTNTASATLTITINASTFTLTFELDDQADFNMFTDNFIINQSGVLANVTFSQQLNNIGLTNSPINIPAITLPNNDSIGILNGTIIISVDGGDTKTISNLKDYAIKSGLVIEEYIAPTAWSLINNSADINIDTLTFYNTNGSLGSQNFNVQSIASIPTGTTYALLEEYLDSTVTLPISNPSADIDLITGSIIINNSAYDIGINFYNSTTQNPTTLMTTTPISLTNNAGNNTLPLITGVASFTIFYNNTESNSQNLITGDDYTITSNNTTFTITPSSTPTPQLTNNTINNGQTCNNVTFYDHTGTQVGTITSTLTTGSSVAIPSDAAYATAEFTNFTNTYDLYSTITVNVSDALSSNMFGAGSITNNNATSGNVYLYGTYYGQTNGIPFVQLNTPIDIYSVKPIAFAPNVQIPIIQGSSTITITDTDNNILINNASIDPNINYYINKVGSIYTLNEYQSSSLLTNNNTTQVQNVQFPGVSGATPIDILGAQASTQIPSTATYTTFDALSNDLLKIYFATNPPTTTNIFTGNILTNNTGYQITITLENNSSTNVGEIAIPAYQSIPLITNATKVSATTTQSGITALSNTALTSGNSYQIEVTSNALQLVAYSTQFLLNNNSGSVVSNLSFIGGSSSETSISTFGYAAIPTGSSSVSFNYPFNGSQTDQIVECTIPVSASNSSAIFTNPLTVLSFTTTNSSTNIGLVTINFYTQLNANGSLINSTPIILDASSSTTYSIPIFANAQSFTVTSNGQTIITSNISGTIQSYNITYNNNTWALTTALSTLVNNFNQSGIITYYDANNSVINSGGTQIQPWATTNILSDAASALVQYQSGNTALILINQGSSKSYQVFSQSLLINSTSTPFLITFYNNSTALCLSQTLLAGDSLPIITGTNYVVVQDPQGSSTIKITEGDINLPASYEIINLTTLGQKALVRAGSSVGQSSSNVGVTKLYGDNGSGSLVAEAILPIIAYGVNQNLFQQFLYVSFYAKVITDLTVQAQVISTVTAIFTAYGQRYSGASNFNYLLSLSPELSTGQTVQTALTAAQATLVAANPSSSSQINKFFTYLTNRIAAVSL